ncbi:pilus assembly protein [Hydrogenophaga sp. BPS33]|uniref:pilus assembly protein n=1 Tax=Hydrogenophaga sp. BPS33 TaxID=2651974 RepID=UPI00131F6C2C|nr:pilus assembly protein [Hydrogenophaga sp. BPS33]QHE86451.1 pilus assembly protein [Hydrogenophaga sp. BPS33]
MNTTVRLHTLLALVGAAALSACTTLPDAAQAEAAQAAAREPSLENQPTYLSLVRQMQGNGMWFASLAHIDALEQRWGISNETRLMRADALRHTDQPAASAALYDKLLDSPERAAAYRGLGLLAGAAQDYARAADMLERARQLQPTDGVLLSDLGYALLRAQRFDVARLPVLQSAQLLPHNAKVRSNLALYLFTQGQADQARQVMQDAGFGERTREAIEQLALELAPQRQTASGLAVPTGLRMSPMLSTAPALATP